MKTIFILLSLTIATITTLLGQQENPYAEFGCKGVVLDAPHQDFDRITYSNPDTLSHCSKIAINFKLHLIAFLDNEDNVLLMKTVSPDALLRWLTTDPAHQFDSPYVGMGNNPVSGVDPDGMYNTKFGAWVANIFHGGSGIDYDRVKDEWYYSKGFATSDGYSGVMPVFTGGFNTYTKSFVNNLGKDVHENVLNNLNYTIDHPLYAVNNLCNSVLTSTSSLLYRQTYIDMYYGVKNYIQAPAEVKGMVDAQAINGMVVNAYAVAPLAAIAPALDVNVSLPVRGSLGNYNYILDKHSAHHSFGPLGKLPHYQLNTWENGVKGSGKTLFRIPLPK